MAVKKTVIKKLHRPKKGRLIGGVALGVANYFNLDVALVRIIWVLLLLPGGLPGFIPYVVCWIIMPSEETTDGSPYPKLNRPK